MGRKSKQDRPLDGLTLDSIAAMKAGMSYGHWKSLHPHTKAMYGLEPVQDDHDYPRCKICGKAIYMKKTNRVYCSEECAYEAQKQACNRRRAERSLRENGQV